MNLGKVKLNKSCKLVGLSLLLCPIASFAIGVGEITLRSGLNQPFSAEVRLLDLNKQTPLNEIKVGLASRDEFKQVGLDRPAFLTDLKFKVKENSAKQPIVYISTNDPIAEPIVSFLLDVNSADGKLLREYTVFLDPPRYMQERIVVQPATQAEPELSPAKPVVEQVHAKPKLIRQRNSFPARTVPITIPPPVDLEPSKIELPKPKLISKVIEKPAAKQPEAVTKLAKPKVAEKKLAAVKEPVAPIVQPKPVAPAVKPTAKPAVTDTVQKFGPVAKSTTLWGVASRYSGKGVSTQQAMSAIYHANPDAFINSNMNELRTGVILAIPSRADMQALTKSKAVDELKQQVTGRVATKPETPVVDDEKEQERISKAVTSPIKVTAVATKPALKRVEPGMDLVQPHRPIPSSMELDQAMLDEDLDAGITEPKLIMKSASGVEAKLMAPTGKDDSEVVKQLKTELVLSTEERNTTKESNQLLNMRVNELEDENVRLRSELQNRYDRMQHMLIEKEQQLRAMQHAKTKEQQQAQFDKQLSGQIVGGSKVEKVKLPEVAETIATETETVSTSEMQIGSNAGFLPSGGEKPWWYHITLITVILIVMLILAGIYWQHRRYLASELEPDSYPDDDEAPKEGRGAWFIDDETIREEFKNEAAETESTDDSGETDSGEIDIFEEVEVLTAYSKYPEAAAILNQALQKQPGDPRLLLKLIGVYAASGDEAAVEKHINELPEDVSGLPEDLQAEIQQLRVDHSFEQPVAAEEAEPITETEPAVEEELVEEPTQAQAQETESSEDENVIEFASGPVEVESSELGTGTTAESADDDNMLEFDTELEVEEPSEPDVEASQTLEEQLATKLDLARAYVDMEDQSEAKKLLDEIIAEGNPEQVKEAEELLERLK